MSNDQFYQVKERIRSLLITNIGDIRGNRIYKVLSYLDNQKMITLSTMICAGIDPDTFTGIFSRSLRAKIESLSNDFLAAIPFLKPKDIFPELPNDPILIDKYNADIENMFNIIVNDRNHKNIFPKHQYFIDKGMIYCLDTVLLIKSISSGINPITNENYSIECFNQIKIKFESFAKLL
jgi:hypothetical protein